MDIASLPILYSLRLCPYAMRARLSLLLAGQAVLLRDVVMDNKPDEMLIASPKGTVPVLVLRDGTVLEQSIDIMLWALNQSDPRKLLNPSQSCCLDPMLEFIEINDRNFVPVLNQYKAASRYRDDSKENHRNNCQALIEKLEQRLEQHRFLFGDNPSLADYAVLPFIRQFSRVDRPWFIQTPYPRLQAWLVTHFNDPVYSKAMIKVPQWLYSQEDLIF